MAYLNDLMDWEYKWEYTYEECHNETMIKYCQIKLRQQNTTCNHKTVAIGRDATALLCLIGGSGNDRLPKLTCTRKNWVIDSSQEISAWTRFFGPCRLLRKRRNFFIRRASSGLDSAEECLDSLFWILSSCTGDEIFPSSEERRVELTHQWSSGTTGLVSGLLSSKRLNFSSLEERRVESTQTFI
ncbi:hypothetical protein AVEN_134268-1 [Araneus ventricosus]|uniref:Uncharacterized protein n=1 Tax=Araneus ventricosus TaxID=182803 RepID=A0A4Y2KJE6_ARAVE|nr:hypothetical protein AVEN_134268-1 [Araneus ventricosus]